MEKNLFLIVNRAIRTVSHAQIITLVRIFFFFSRILSLQLFGSYIHYYNIILLTILLVRITTCNINYTYYNNYLPKIPILFYS